MDDCTPQVEVSARGLVREPELWLLALLAAVTYFARLDTLSVRGEEPRRARVAYEMLATGDFVVPRQQGQVYLSRPPLGNWLIAACGTLRGRIDALAIRLPSALATVLTSLLLYVYGRAWLSRLGAFVAGLAYATMALTLELGRLGETDAVLACLVSSSLLVWHYGLQRGWPPALVWCLGYGLAALAGLAKGPQGICYFVAPVAAYLAWRRDWSLLCSREHLAGLTTLCLVVAAWQIPFALATDWHSVQTIWWGNAAARFVEQPASALAWHLVLYPLEIGAGLLPWSLPLSYLLGRRFRASLADVWPWASFSLLAIGICFPSVWWAAGARGRYFLPLFPCFAVLTGLVVDRCWSSAIGAIDRRALNCFLRGVSWVAAAFAVALGATMATGNARGAVLTVPTVAACLTAALAAAWGLRTAASARSAATAVAGFSALACLLASIAGGLVTDLRQSQSVDTAAEVVALKARLPVDARLVSLGQISHAFAYHFGGSIPLLADSGDEPEYFCFNRLCGERVAVPFVWERVAVVSLDRARRAVPERTVVVGRRLAQPVVRGAEFAALQSNESDTMSRLHATADSAN